MRIFILVFILLGVMASGSIAAQDYLPPLNIPLVLSGNFGEIRSNHFHTGLDIKTQGRTGLPVVSIADGEVVRIKVSPYGYGLALYIKHPDGNTSVYGHLDRFAPDIAAWVEDQQYQKESFALNLYPQAGQFPVKQGQEIGKSGNSGSSGGPHLHFEIRDTRTEEPLNPQQFGFKINDSTLPSVYGLQVEAMDEGSHVNGKGQDNFSMGGSYGNYALKNGETITANGNIAFSLHTIDRYDDANNKCGIYSIVFVAAGDTLYQVQFDRLNFSTNRYINAHINYPLYSTYKKHYHRLHQVKNNALAIYPTLKNKGVLACTEDKEIPVSITVWDWMGNQSQLNFTVNSTSEQKLRALPATPYQQRVKCMEQFEWKSEMATVSIPAATLYYDAELDFKSEIREDGLPELTVGNDKFAAQKAFTLRLKIPEALLPYQENLYLGKVAANDRIYPDNTGDVVNGWFTAKNREFGTYTLALDTIAPSVRAFNLSDGKTVRNGNRLRFRIKDGGAGIDSYNLYIDDQWALATYDFRTGAVTHTFDSNRVTAGDHVLKLVVTDKLGNTETLSYSITSY